MGQFRFYVDIISILGSNAFSSIHRYFSLFGLFKMLRVLRIGKMIANTTLDEVSKAGLNLIKLMFYLFFYLHLIGCYYWITIGYNSSIRYYGHPDDN